MLRTPNTVWQLSKTKSNKFLETTLCSAFFYASKFPFTPVLVHAQIHYRPEGSSCIPCNHETIRTLELVLVMCLST